MKLQDITTSLFYYLEYEESIKTPSWKRRMHRFHNSVNVKDVVELNDQLYLAELAYADSVEDIQFGLKHHPTNKKKGKEEEDGWELAYCQMKSLPGKPSHYLAVRRPSSSSSSPYLDVLLVARDAMLDTTPYGTTTTTTTSKEGSVAHAG
eukprot:7655840-Ditylum_brightwellii.AAC.1